MRPMNEIMDRIPYRLTVFGKTYATELTIGNLRGTVCFSDDEDGWEHVSFAPYHKEKTPTWADMCELKDVFWDEEEEAIQIHPKKSQYVNITDNCLHLWARPGLLSPYEDKA